MFHFTGDSGLPGRFTILLALSLLVLGISVLSTAPLGSCEEGCPDDDSEGRCAPFCAECSCCPHPGPLMVRPAPLSPAPTPAVEIAERAAPTPKPPHSPEIFHVPKPPSS